MRGVMTFVSTQYPDVSCPPPNMHSTCTLIAGLAGWNRNLTPNHTVCWWGISISALLFWFFKDVGEWFISRRQSVYTHTHIIKYHIWHVPHTHHIYAKTIDTLTKCFSHFLFGVAKEHSEEEMHDWVRATESISGRKPLKPFLLFVVEPRFSSPLSFLFHDIVCFWSSKLSNKIPLLLTATHRVCFH